MPNQWSIGKPNATPSYTGTPRPEPASAGQLQTAGWVDPAGISYGAPFSVETLEAVPANVRVQLSGVLKTGPSQYAATLSLSGTNTLQLVPNAADAQQNPTSAVAPNVFSWSFSSRNNSICTVNSSGLVTAVGRGECEITVRSFRQVNASFAGGTPSGTEGVDASVNVTVLA